MLSPSSASSGQHAHPGSASQSTTSLTAGQLLISLPPPEIACKILLCMEDDPIPMEDDEMFERIDEIIQESIRPVMKADRGDIALVGVSDGIVTVALEKPSVPTAFSSFLMTFKVRKGCSCGRCAVPVVAVIEGVLKRLREEVPGVREVVVAKDG